MSGLKNGAATTDTMTQIDTIQKQIAALDAQKAELKLQLQNFEKIKKTIPKSQDEREMLFQALADVLGPSRVNALLGRSTEQSETKKSTSRASYDDNSEAVIAYLRDKPFPESKSEIEIGIGIQFTPAHWVRVRKDISAKGWILETYGQSRSTTYSIAKSGKKAAKTKVRDVMVDVTA